MPLVILAVGIAFLLLLMVKFKLNGFIALILTAILVGLLQGLPFLGTEENPGVMDAIVDGVGGQVDDLILILGFGAMLGVLMADMGAAHRLAKTLLDTFGEKFAQFAIVIVAFLIGVVLFWETAWVILIPIVFASVRRMRVPLLYLALPLAIALSTMHSFLPPHPGPTAVADMFGASVGQALVYGLIISIPIGLVVGLGWPHMPFVKSAKASIPAGLVKEKEFSEDEMPGFGISLAITALPVVLIAGAAILELTVPQAPITSVALAVGDAPVALLIGLMFALGYYAIVRKIPMDELMCSCGGAIKSIAMIIFIIGAGGAFKQILLEGGISEYIQSTTSTWALSPIILAWLIAVVMRLALGSASVAVVAAAGIALPLVEAGAVSPELMVLAVACGSVAFSHLNDPGFWMFKEFLNMSLMDTIKVRTTYTTVLSILGLCGVLILNLFVGA